MISVGSQLRPSCELIFVKYRNASKLRRIFRSE
jgi:hypothetical protein